MRTVIIVAISLGLIGLAYWSYTKFQKNKFIPPRTSPPDLLSINEPIDEPIIITPDKPMIINPDKPMVMTLTPLTMPA